MTQIDVDFNALGRDGLLKVSRRRADSDFSVGDVVDVYDSTEPDMRYQAVIESMEDTGRAWARVNWAPRTMMQASPWSATPTNLIDALIVSSMSTKPVLVNEEAFSVRGRVGVPSVVASEPVAEAV